MIYFKPMKKRSKNLKKAEDNNHIVIILSIPLIFFKFIGDSLLKIVITFLSATNKSYKNIISLLIHLKQLRFNLPKFKAIPKKKPLPKHKLIYKKKESWTFFLIKKIRFLKYTITRPNTKNYRFETSQDADRGRKIRNTIYWKNFFLRIKYFSFGALIVAIIAFCIQINSLIKSLPNPSFLTLRDIPATTKIYDRNEKLLYEIYSDEDRTPVKLSDVPAMIKNATIATEDKDFFNHIGFSTKGIMRALWHNFTNDTEEGGSTITQQLIRSALLTPEKTYNRKLKEIVLSVWAEQIYSKEQILEMYLNQVPYGGTAWGIEAASETYFGKHVNELNLAEGALLAGLPAAPTFYSPFGAHPELAKRRQEEVLRRMEQSGFITSDEFEKAKQVKLDYRKPNIPINAPHFVMYVKGLLEEQFGQRMVERGGLRVITTLDLDLQEMAQSIVSTNIENLKSLNVGNGAALITNPTNGEIRAMVGSADFFDFKNEGNVNIALALRQPGSSIKVVNYAAALKQGFTAASIIEDTPIIYKSLGQTTYSPVNYDGKYHGAVTLRTALASSYNIPAVKVLAKIGVNNMVEQGRLMGIESWKDIGNFGLSLTLGGGEVTMLDMAKVYGTLATGGIKHELNPFIKITNFKGDEFHFPQANTIQAVSPGIAFILTSILSDNNARTPAFGANSSLLIRSKTVAVKTGTSDSKRDNWTIGYTPDLVVTTWVGNNDNSPMNPKLTSGITGAAPIWNQIITNLLKDKPDKITLPPEEIINFPCFGRTEYFIRGTEPKRGCVLPPTTIPLPTKV